VFRNGSPSKRDSTRAHRIDQAVSGSEGTRNPPSSYVVLEEEPAPRADLKAVVFEDLVEGVAISIFEIDLCRVKAEDENTVDEGDDGLKL
jgi:hypothetical protein